MLHTHALPLSFSLEKLTNKFLQKLHCKILGDSPPVSAIVISCVLEIRHDKGPQLEVTLKVPTDPWREPQIPQQQLAILWF
jgi:hypothetical protein